MKTIAVPRVLYAFLYNVVHQNQKSYVDPAFVLQQLGSLLRLPVSKEGDDYHIGNAKLPVFRESGSERLSKVDLVDALYRYSFGEDLEVGFVATASAYSQREQPRLFLGAFDAKLKEREQRAE